MEHVCGRAFRPNSFGKANTLTMQHWQNLNVLQLTCRENGFGNPAWLVEEVCSRGPSRAWESFIKMLMELPS